MEDDCPDPFALLDERIARAEERLVRIKGDVAIQEKRIRELEVERERMVRQAQCA